MSKKYLRCVCGRKMHWIGDTLLCLRCNQPEVYEYYGWVRKMVDENEM